MQRESKELFLLAVLSVMDAVLNMRMGDVPLQIPVEDDIKLALIGQLHGYGPMLPDLYCRPHVG